MRSESSSGAGEEVDALVRELPDPEGARLFYERVVAEHPPARRLFERDAGLLSDALALAAWSPLLGTTLAQQPEHLQWLARERVASRVKTTEELGESLARFALTHTQAGTQVILARFRRRELLRVYLHDLRHTTTLVETTEELSNLADAVLAYALQLAQSELENLYGAPQCTDERGRKRSASLCIVALGKLGSRELNYSSDIDLLFIYSEDGETSGTGERGAITNREFFCKLAEGVARLVGQPSGEGAAYRVDLRLRPHGRDGALAVSLREALRYYHETAHAWELQALIRQRASAGSPQLFARFSEGLRERVYRRDETVAHALFNVRLAKQKIDRFHRREAGGYNVKLGRGGIRELEFIAQALQLAHGGRDPWLHAPHTLISLSRLADRHLVTERETTSLSDAYTFLRMLEHRLQMEHGLQTHTLPDDPARRSLVARRMHFHGASALEEFEQALRTHIANVRAVYDRVFGDTEDDAAQATATTDAATATPRVTATPAPDARAPAAPEASPAPRGSALAHPAPDDRGARTPEDDAEKAAHAAAVVFAPHIAGALEETTGKVARRLLDAARGSLNPKRALALLARVASSLDKSDADVELNLNEEDLGALARLCGGSEFLGEMVAANPELIPALAARAEAVGERDHRAVLRAAVDGGRSFREELSALRRAWARLLVEIGARDVEGDITPAESNRLQTTLAAASLNAALLVARREIARHHGPFAAGPRLSVLGLGRLASGGMDYGSDLDIILVYDPKVPPPIGGLSHDESYARLSEPFASALSNLTRDGYLYRVDLRLRPDGRNGPVAVGARSFVNYIRERAGVWELLAYVKLRAVAGDLELGRAVETEARRTVHEAARRAGAEVLRAETRRVRERLEREHTRGQGRHGTDIKYGPGGMLDVYFAARYLQLRDDVADVGDDRSTRATLARLHENGSLGETDFHALDRGYALLRRIDHHLRLLAGRSTRLPAAPDHPVLSDLSRRTGHAAPAALVSDLDAHTAAVRAAYLRVVEG
ncbi:MAG TPA: hypothetical protein VF240_02210 [Pyrinomonadaceae bacterium]